MWKKMGNIVLGNLAWISTNSIPSMLLPPSQQTWGVSWIYVRYKMMKHSSSLGKRKYYVMEKGLTFFSNKNLWAVEHHADQITAEFYFVKESME